MLSLGGDAEAAEVVKRHELFEEPTQLQPPPPSKRARQNKASLAASTASASTVTVAAKTVKFHVLLISHEVT